jgi:hypothetical protein
MPSKTSSTLNQLIPSQTVAVHSGSAPGRVVNFNAGFLAVPVIAPLSRYAGIDIDAGF